MTASVGFSIFGSSRVSTRMSRGAWSTAPRMMIPFVGWWGRGPCGQGDRSVAGEDLLGDGHRRERLRPAGVERQVCDRFDQLVFGGAVVLRVLHQSCRELAEHSFGARRLTVCGGVGHCCPSMVVSGFLRFE